MAIFTMKLTAPVVSLSGPRIDTKSDNLPIPTRSMITGMIGAALGLDYDNHDMLQKVQDTMRLAVVVHRAGTIERDYQTVRMGQPRMIGPMRWHDGRRFGTMERAGGEPERTLTGERPLTCDYDATVVVELLDGSPFDAGQILVALREPVYPVSIGQRSCLPSGPIAGVVLDVTSLDEAVPLVGAGDVYLPAKRTGEFGDVYLSVPAGRDWRSRQHGGSDTYVLRIQMPNSVIHEVGNVQHSDRH
jgi:CRISPR system Cascade subunit CasD